MHSLRFYCIKSGLNSNLMQIKSSLILLSSKSLSSTATSSYPVKNMKIRIPASVDGRLKKTSHFYPGLSKKEININVEYADTDDTNSKKRVILALHGAPGSHHDFSKLIEFFAPNYRLLAPNFPSVDLTRETRAYWHSAEEKTLFIRTFLSNLDVHTIDCLVCHSGGAFPGSFLWSEQNSNLRIKSVALFNIPSHTWPGFFITQLVRFMTANFEIFMNLKPTSLAPLLGFTHSGNDFQLLESGLASSRGRMDSLHERLKFLVDNKIPTLFLMSEKDNVIKGKYFLDVANMLNADDSNFSVFDGKKDDIKLTSSATDCRLIHVVNIKPGGHYAFIKHSHVVNPLLQKLIANKNYL